MRVTLISKKWQKVPGRNSALGVRIKAGFEYISMYRCSQFLFGHASTNFRYLNENEDGAI